MLFFGPLAQFDLVEKVPSCSFDIMPVITGITEFDDTLFFITLMLIFWQTFEYYNETVKADNIIDFDEEMVVVDIVSKKNYNYSDIITIFFSLIFICNFSGLIPYSQTVTAQILFTFVLSLITILIIWFHAFSDNKIQILNHFLPAGSPLVITPFIILIELISNFSRIISLAVRLFANITSGHALLKILASFGLVALSIISVWKTLVIFPIIIIFIITILELLIAFLQTYVFITLALIYVSEQE